MPSFLSAPAAPSPLGPHAAPGGRDFWPWLSLALGLLWLTSMAAWWRARQPNHTPAPMAIAPVADASHSGTARKAFRQACHDNDAPAARRNLLIWARANWPLDPPAGLNALAVRLNQPGLQDLLRELDRACYAGSEWHGTALAEALSALPGKVEKTGAKASALADLYP